MQKDNILLFWGGPFSQWYKCTIIIDNVVYNCAEQYMMAMKAKLFNDEHTHTLIMKEKNPRKQKQLGRLVANFNHDTWDAVAQEIVFQASLAKFSIPDLKELLLNTGNKILAEASPEDAIWGIGLSIDDPACYDQTQWRGKNWLGIALMRVRETL